MGIPQSSTKKKKQEKGKWFTQKITYQFLNISDELGHIHPRLCYEIDFVPWTQLILNLACDVHWDSCNLE